MDDVTTSFDVVEFRKTEIITTLEKVYEILKERGYEPLNQLSGYLISGDPGYISGYKNARSMILKFDRSEIVKILLQESMEK